MEELILKEREFKKNICELINKSELPAFCLKPILKDLLEQINLLENQQYIQAKKKMGGKTNGNKDK